MEPAMASSNRNALVRSEPSLVNERGSLAPGQEEAEVTGETTGKIQHARRQPEIERLQVALPAQVELRGLAAQRARPVRLGRVDRASAVAAELAGEAEQHELLLAPLGGRPHSAQGILPDLV